MDNLTSVLFRLLIPVLIIPGIGIFGYSFFIRSPGTNQKSGNTNESSAVVTGIPAREALPSDAWNVFTSSSGELAPQNDRYRLAGTFFLMGSDDSNAERQRLAIIDDLSSNQQYMVSEGQSFQDYEILRIYQDRLIMRRDAMEVELSLGFKNVTGEPSAIGASTNMQTDTMLGQEVLESNRFGKRIGEKRWVIDKQAIVGYYQELLDDPERIAAVYMSLKPAYSEEGSVSGYTLQKEGESEFFDAVGLLEGDTIRRVNSMRMTSQKRAEYFIGEFMQERLGAVVLDIERNGKEEKLIYLFR